MNRVPQNEKVQKTMKKAENQAWWLIPVILALRSQRQVDCHKFEVTLGHRVSSRLLRLYCDLLSHILKNC